jgi:hypothetical protein
MLRLLFLPHDDLDIGLRTMVAIVSWVAMGQARMSEWRSSPSKEGATKRVGRVLAMSCITTHFSERSTLVLTYRTEHLKGSIKTI